MKTMKQKIKDLAPKTPTRPRWRPERHYWVVVDPSGYPLLRTMQSHRYLSIQAYADLYGKNLPPYRKVDYKNFWKGEYACNYRCREVRLILAEGK